MAKRKHAVFVYGTLKRGYGNNRIIEEATFLEEARTADNYTLANTGIPFASPGGEYPVKGELFLVNDHELARMDRLEGHPNFYRREKRKILTSRGEAEAWIYEHPLDRIRGPVLCPTVDMDGETCYEWNR